MTYISKWWVAAVVFPAISLVGVRGATPPPDPCKLITVAEVEAIVGRLEGAPVPGGAGEVCCEYKPAQGARWVEVRLHEGDLSSWKKRNGGPKPVPMPEFGKDAFMNPDADGSVELFAKKGDFVLRVSIPNDQGNAQVTPMVLAIARKALARM